MKKPNEDILWPIFRNTKVPYNCVIFSKNMVFEYFNNSPYFKAFLGIFLENSAACIMGLTAKRKNANLTSLSSSHI